MLAKTLAISVDPYLKDRMRDAAKEPYIVSHDAVRGVQGS